MGCGHAGTAPNRNRARAAIRYRPARLAATGDWGLSATGALAIAVAAAFSDAGSRRLMASAPAPNAAGTAQKAAPPAAPAPDRDAESRRLSEVLGTLVADREQLVARIGAIERNLEDVTGSIQRQAAAAAAAPSAPAPPSPAAAAAAPSAPVPPSPPAAAPAPPPPSKEAALTPAEPGNPASPARAPVAPETRAARTGPRPGGAPRCAARSRVGRDPRRVWRRHRRRGEFRRPAGTLGLDQGQQCGLVGRPPPGGGDARKFAHQGSRAAAHCGPAGQRGGGGAPLRNAHGRAPLLPAGRVRGPASGPCRHRAGAQTCCRAESGAGCVAEIDMAVALSAFRLNGNRIARLFICRFFSRKAGSCLKML